jgi:hypothetical protein
MRPHGDSSLLNFEFEVLDGNDLPHSWVGRKVGVETVTAPGMLVGWLQSKSAWRLIVVEDRTGEVSCVPWIAVEAIVLVEEESGVPGSSETVAEGADWGAPRSGTEGPQEAAQPRSWWRRMFGG